MQTHEIKCGKKLEIITEEGSSLEQLLTQFHVKIIVFQGEDGEYIRVHDIDGHLVRKNFNDFYGPADYAPIVFYLREQKIIEIQCDLEGNTTCTVFPVEKWVPAFRFSAERSALALDNVLGLLQKENISDEKNLLENYISFHADMSFKAGFFEKKPEQLIGILVRIYLGHFQDIYPSIDYLAAEKVYAALAKYCNEHDCPIPFSLATRFVENNEDSGPPYRALLPERSLFSTNNCLVM